MLYCIRMVMSNIISISSEGSTAQCASYAATVLLHLTVKIITPECYFVVKVDRNNLSRSVSVLLFLLLVLFLFYVNRRRNSFISFGSNKYNNYRWSTGGGLAEDLNIDINRRRFCNFEIAWSSPRSPILIHHVGHVLS